MQKPAHLTWEEAACYTLTLATAYRMLFGHPPHTLKPGDNVLVWGASGGLGVFGVQLVAASGANAIAVVSDESKMRIRASISAPKASSTARSSSAGASCRRSTRAEYNDWTKEARRFGKAIWDITGKRDVDIVFEHPGEADLPGVVHGGEARRHGGVLRRHHRLQHHLRRALRVDAAEAHPGLALRAFEAGEPGQPLRLERRIDPCMSEVFPWENIPLAHMKMWKNQHPPGNMSVLVNAPRTGLRNFEDTVEAAGG